ncbi:methyl-accepting chemotaxis protein [Roseateles amylovorans]|uniref:methyl-accepting chemotaxis protein n=1 Tax=Roseateles amylovorans TaxID=2978473 RepID=UPI0025B63D05|nr:methyl-accepting chemotaxis protein [Roseateles amylovorans]
MTFSIATRLWIPVVVMAAMTLVMSLGAASRTRALLAVAQTTQEKQQQRFELALRWRGLTEANASRVQGGLAAGDNSVADALKADIARTTETISGIQKQLEALAEDEADKAAMTRIAERRQAYIAARNEASKLKTAGQVDAARAALSQKVVPAIEQYLTAQQDFIKLQQDKSSALREAAGAERMRTVWGVAGVMSLIVGLLALATLYFVRTISSPLKQLVGQAERIGQGDLSDDGVQPRGDEIGDVQRALAQMKASLRGVIREFRTSVDSMQTASLEIATGNTDLSHRTEQTASNLQQAASSLSQLTGTVTQSADSARTANQLAGTAAEVARRGGAAVGEVVGTMNEIDASAKRINDIIGVIDGIAFQTNILALNAAVEAARAGEQGRGFAVVASEVRALAQRSAEAAKEIKSLIGDSVTKVETGSQQVRDAGATMNEIVASVQRVSDIISEISASTVEQSQGIGSVNGSVAQLDQMTQQNAALVEQSAAAAESLSDQASKLTALVARFRLDEGSTPAGIGLAASSGTPASMTATATRAAATSASSGSASRFSSASKASTSPMRPSTTRASTAPVKAASRPVAKAGATAAKPMSSAKPAASRATSGLGASGLKAKATSAPRPSMSTDAAAPSTSSASSSSASKVPSASSAPGDDWETF